MGGDDIFESVSSEFKLIELHFMITSLQILDKTSEINYSGFTFPKQTVAQAGAPWATGRGENVV